MKVTDGMLGSFDIGEGVLTELLKAKEVTRLKGIAQQGVPKEMLDKGMPAYSRYEHSVCVMLLLRKFGTSVEEQAAGLLHDVSHTAFSHVVDWTIGDRSKEDYQDRIHSTYFHGTGIARILEKHGMDASRISNPSNYGLLEREIPDICADRIEGNLKYWHYMGMKNIVRESLGGLVVKDGEMAFGSVSAARTFGVSYFGWQDEGDGWGGKAYPPQELTVKWLMLSRLLGLALDKGIISRSDFSTDDRHVLDKLKGSRDKEIRSALRSMYAAPRFRMVKSSKSVFVREKFRYVDPKCLVRGRLVRLSAIDANYKRLIGERRRKNKRGLNIEFD